MPTALHLATTTNGVNGAGPTPVSPGKISGNYLAFNRHDAIGKAFMAAELNLGVRALRNPTITQAALLARVNRTYAFWAVKRFPNRAEGR
jgi:hypothetical protein